MRKLISLLLLMGAFGYGLAQPIAIDTSLFGHVPSAHHLTYWFDAASDATHELPLSQTTLQVDASSLSLGVHTFHCYAVDSAGVVYPTASAMFFRPPAAGTDTTAAQAVVYWFDQAFESRVTVPHGGSFLMDVSGLPVGVHTIHSYVLGADSVVYPTTSVMFFRPPAMGTDSTAAQAVVYWFDQAFDSRVTLPQGGVQLLDVSGLPVGMHTLHSYVVGADNKAYPTTSVMFFRPPYINTDTVEVQAVVCWFDQAFEDRHVISAQGGAQLLDVSGLPVGVHTLHSYVVGADNKAYPTTSSMFFRPPAMGTDSTAAQEVVYWFDQAFDSRVTMPQGGVQLLDVSDLPVGVHTLHSYAVGADSVVYPTTSAMFFRPPAIGADSTAAQSVVYWFDQAFESRVTMPQGGVQLLDVSDLPIGVHTLHSYAVGADNKVYPTTSAMFFRPPVGGSEGREGISQYYYWQNEDIAHATKVDVSPVTNPLQWYGLIQIDPTPFRSSYFHFEIDTAQQPHAYAKNTFHTLFMDDMGRFVMGDVMPFIDYHVSQPIVSDTIERGTTKTITVPTNNNIHWFKLGVGVGDSLSFTTNKRCTMQLYAPSGEMVFHSSGDSVLSWVGCHAWENGVYYLAVHDAEGTGNMTVSYQWVYRYAVLAWDVHRVGNGGISTITFEGNGFNNLDTVYLVKGLDTIPALFLDHESNATLIAAFDFEYTDTGTYNAFFVFTDENMSISNVVIVESAVPIILSSNVSYPQTFLRGSTVTYTFNITNTGNMTAYNVPLYTYIGSPTRNSISHIKFDGLNLPSIIAGLDMDSISVEDRVELQEWAEYMGDDHYFYKIKAYDSISGDSIWVRSNYFFLTLKPYETRNLQLSITATGTVDVWFTLPDTIASLRVPMTDTTHRPLPMMAKSSSWGGYARDGYCCVKDHISCILNIASEALDIVNLITEAAPGTPAALASAAASCIVGLAQNFNTGFSKWLCPEENNNENIIDLFQNAMDWESVTSTAIKCVKRFIPNMPGKTIIELASKITDMIDNILKASGYSHASTVVNCITAFGKKRPNCPPVPPKGGQSQPYVPVDPNEIVGYIAESGSTYIPDSVQTVDYFIECENDPVMAQAAAHKVTIVDTLSSQLFDLSTFRPTQVTIGENSIFLDGAQNGVYTMDLRPNINTLAQVSVNYTSTTGVARWTIEALDPITLTPTLDVNEGVLPPNTDGSGIARVYYSFGLRNTLGDGDSVSNRAYITFDFEDAIATPVWTNIIDAVSPTSRIAYGNMEGDTLSLSFQATDNRSGVWKYDVFGRRDSLDSWHLVNTGKTSVQRLAVDSLLSDFYVVAIDSAGNRENKPAQAEYNTVRGLVGPTVTTYQVQFVNYDNTVLGSYRLPSGAMPAYLGGEPMRHADAHYSYRFRGWTPSLASVTGNAIYRAVYDSLPNSYRIAFYDYDSTLLQVDSLPYGTMPTYYSMIPTRYDVDSFVYAFVGWEPELAAVTGNADYRPVFDSMVYYQLPRYLVTFRDWDGSVLQSDSVEFGQLPNYWGAEPVRTGNAYCAYRFSGWSPRIIPVTDSITYTAVFDTLLNTYPVVFVNFNGAVLQRDTLPYGSMPVYRGNTPARRASMQYIYTFAGWNPNLDTVRGEAVYMAIFDSVLNCVTQYGYDSVTACDTLMWRGNRYATTGTYTQLVEDVANGCDSIYVLNLTLVTKSFTTESQVACDSYTWHGQTYLTTTTALDTLTNAVGCDSVVTLHLTLNHSNMGSESVTACDSYAWHGQTYLASATAMDTLSNASGCDSVVTLHLTLNHSNMGSESVTACDSYAWHGQTYLASATAMDTLSNASGCDSVVTLHLTLNHSNMGGESVTACDSYAWHGQTYLASATAMDTLSNASGCDSVVTLHLTLNHSNMGSESVTACDSYAWHGQTYLASSTAMDTLSNASGCDSVVILHLTLNHSNTGGESVTACDNYAWHGQTYLASATAMDTLSNASGCDSVVTLHLTLNHSNMGSESVTACDSYAWHGQTYLASSTAMDTLSNASGCDSVVTLHLTLNHSNMGSESVTACDSYAWHGQTYLASSTAMDTLSNASGCDSVVTLNLTINNATSGEFDLVDCDSIVWSDWTFYTSTDTNIVLTNSVGCDSLNTLHLQVNYSSRTTVTDTAEDSYVWNGETYTESGEYVFTGQTEAGCDSIVTLFLTITQTEGIMLNDGVEVTLYPNPTTGRVTIDGVDVTRIEVYALDGRLLATFSNSNSFDISQLSSGTYFVRVISPQGEARQRVIKD